MRKRAEVSSTASFSLREKAQCQDTAAEVKSLYLLLLLSNFLFIYASKQAISSLSDKQKSKEVVLRFAWRMMSRIFV